MWPDRNTIKLLRIPFSFFLMPLFVFALSQVDHIMFPEALFAFIIIHLLVYPASNGYNSYIDRDEGSIGGLEKPPLPTETLFYTVSVMDFLAIALGFLLVGPLFAGCLFLYILASRAYSSRVIRLKKYPFIGFLVVVVFQGAFTYYMSYLGVSGHPLILNQANGYVLLGCSFQIAGAYPLTQIYQHEEDLKDGVVTLSYKLGYKGTFVFTAVMFLICNIFYYLYFQSIGKITFFYVIQACFLPIVLYFVYWFSLVTKNVIHANFRNTMRMNLIAAIGMNACFALLTLFNHCF